MTQEEAIAILRKANWRDLIEERTELEFAAGGFCEPGIGMVFEEGEILHLLEPEKPPYRGFYHYNEPRKILGLFPSTTNSTYEFTGLSDEGLKRIVRNWSPSDHRSVIAVLNEDDLRSR